MSRHTNHDARSLLFTNDSDSQDIKDDYVSFPILPDPEQVTDRSLSTIISKTLRKVTNNASNLVHTYTSPRHPTAPDVTNDRMDDLSVYSHFGSSPENPDSIHEDFRPVLAPKTATKNPPPEQNGPVGPSVSIPLSTAASESFNVLGTNSVQISTPNTPMPPPLTENFAGGARARPSDVSFMNSEEPPRVTSDNRFLRISTMQTGSMVSKSEITVETAPGPLEATSVPSEPEVVESKPKQPANPSSNLSQKTLQNRISSIFNNLPNDIELSDDSASDLETINNDSASSPSHPNKSLFYDRSAVDLSPARAERDRLVQSGRQSESPSTSTFYAFRSKAPYVTRKISANFPAILDGAKNIIHSNIVTSSTSSMIGDRRKKKKKKAPKISENPLKNGGIPKKYWMNDSFVSDCLNCFKPFSAFRRKHHCRFCGQIFCANCTLFISFSQYKQQRRAKDGAASRESKTYSDKLRVCKPCYSDVIVYLSDDSMSSSSSEEETETNDVFNFEDAINSEKDDEFQVADHPLSRLRSRSISSRRTSFANESSVLAGNRAFLNGKAMSESPALLATTPILNPDFSQRGPDNISFKHAPQMAIPTTRTGEAVEIPVSKSSYGSSAANLKSNLTLIAMQNAANAMVAPTVPSAMLKEPQKNSWAFPYTHHNTSSPEMALAHSLENLSLLYNSFLGKSIAPRGGRASDSDYRKRRHPLLSSGQQETEQEEDIESENEDEQVMSLYTSLNHGQLHTSVPQSNLSPRPSAMNTSMSVVPTLHEFPTMSVSDKYIPATLDSASIGPWKRVDFNLMDSFHNATINENKQRSDHRSSERANASLIRMSLKRKSKLVRNRLLLTQNNLKLPPMDTSFTSTAHTTSSPLSTPASPTPRSQLGFLASKDFPHRSNSNPGMQPAELLHSSIPNMLKYPDDREITQVLHYTLDDHLHDNQRSFYTDSDLLNYFDSFTPSLDKLFDGHIDKMLIQCLEDCDIKDPKEQARWKTVLVDTFLHIDKLKITDTLDIKQYVKIKKIFGGAVEDTKVIDGLFITKNIDSKRMQHVIKAPKIALLMFPIEYLKQKEQFISLRIVNSQQSVYISNLVSRLVSLEPDVVVVGDTVCGLAENLLEEAGVTVLSNVKPQVIERISRYTKGDIFQSVNDLFFKKGSLGSCGLFEVKKFVFKDMIKTYSFFTGSELESGFTICLRGGDEELLSSAKYAAESLIPGILNAKFEKALFKDLSLVIEETGVEPGIETFELLQNCIKSEDGIKNDTKAGCVQSIEHYGVCNYIKLFGERLLSVSPSVHFTLPKALLNLSQAFEEFVEFDKFNSMIQQITIEDEIDVLWLSKLNFDFNLERFNGKEDVIRILKFVGENTLNSLLNEFNFRSRIWSNSQKHTSYQLYPIFHKSIHFLHSTVSIKHATPCSGPVIVVIDYYTDNDKCLGMFLDQALQDSSNICDECGDLLLNHYKTYVHDNAKIDLIMEKVDNVQGDHDFKGKNERIMWSYCPECNISTPIVIMSDETYYLSLGKFFELNFWAQGVSFYKDCPHDYFKKHVKYFGFNDVVIRLEYSQIDTFEVVVPRKKLEFTLETDITLKIEALEQIQMKTNSFFQSISKRLNRVKVDTFDKAEAGHEKIEELKQRLETQQMFISSKTFNIYNSTLPTNYLSLNVVQRDLQELGVEWDSEFNDFERNFLPTENEITKITQFHLRNFLMDRLDTDMMKGRGTDFEKIQEEADDGKEDSKTEGPSNDDSGSPLDKKDYFAFGSRRVPLSIIESKILKIKQSFENDNHKFAKSPALSRSESVVGELGSPSEPPTKVQDLTNFFNQMTLEFQRQRGEDLEKSIKVKANPILNPQPVAEIYDKIEDVVDVNDDLRDRRVRRPLLRNSSTATILRTPADSSRNTPFDQMSQKSFLPLKRGDQALLNEIHRRSLPLKDIVGKQKLEIPQPERNSLLKSLTNFWADRSATLWDPLEYPLDFTEHTFADSDVIVREDEPSSLVAFCLSSNDYKQKIIDMASNIDGDNSDNLESNELYKKKVNTFIKIEKKFKKKIDDARNGMSELEATMTKTKSNHLKYQFLDGNTDLSCKIFYSEQFEAFRKACGIDDSFIQSLSRCVKWNSTGGKSGSNFLKTLDNRYILKELSKSELESFVSIAPFYFKYISQSTFNTLTTAIAKIFGFYQVEIKNSVNGKTFRMDFLIMENLFYNRQTTRIFDLKGSMRNRHVKQTGKENEVLLDENMIEYIYESPVFVKEQLKKLLRGSLFNDTSFLSAMDVMDYSLVIGIDDTSHRLYVGIIDWLRTFTWDKKVENWVKGNTLVGKKGKDPTIVTPKQYRIRFREAMDRYILEVPDIWYEGK